MLSKESIKLELNVPAKMRDGTILYADLWRPDTEEKYPTILTRLPYIPSNDSDSLLTQSGYMNPQRFVRAGYAVVIQDCRGTGASEGEPCFWRQERNDGYDTVEWIATQPWCNGNVGMYGISYFGYTQWAAAVTQPPHLKTICPMGAQANFRAHPFSDRGDAFRLTTYESFCLRLAENTLMRKHLAHDKLKSLRERITYLSDNWEELVNTLPLKDSPVAKIVKELNLAPPSSELLENMQDDNYWRQYGDPFPFEKVIIPGFHICGWYDPISGPGILQSYQEMMARGGSDSARRNQKLLVGPWIHALDLQNLVGELDFGKESSGDFIDVTGMHIRWFDYWLKGIDNGIMDEPPVRIFIMGDNVWRDENGWPLARTKYTKYYFHSGGHSNSSLGNGVLSTEVPNKEQPDVYLYNPRNPVPSNPLGFGLGFGQQCLFDLQELEKRADILVYTSAPLKTDLEVTGPIQIKLWAASSAVDTDFTGKLVDVWPNGKAYNLVDGLIRARYRESVSEPKLIEPGHIYEYTITLGNTSNLFKAGHRIRVEIASSYFPRYDRNLNTGNPIGQDTEIKTATQTVYHEREYASYILLPIIPR
jgi:putative CocE/NonD family hydrolase